MLSLARAALENCFITENQVVILTESDLDSGHIYHIFFPLHRVESHRIALHHNRGESYRKLLQIYRIVG